MDDVVRASFDAGSREAAEDRCVIDPASDPVTIVIFGATGDLTARKVFPAVHTLFVNGLMPERFCIVGASRTQLSDDDFRERMRKSVSGSQGPERWDELAPRLFYAPVSFDDALSFKELGKRLKDLDAEFRTDGNRLFYLAVPPSAYEPIARGIGAAGLSREGGEGQGWARLVVEKPFGHDLASAKQLDRTLLEHFGERQIYRIDHYMAKETVQNILTLRFANAIFEPLWNRRYIDYVRITAAESLGVEHRAGFYEQAGVLRDMFQNHMMMLLSLCAMEPPSIYEPERVRDEKTKVFRALKPFPVKSLEDHLVLGQYSAGVVDGRKVPAYVDEPGVAADSLTPTYALMKVFIDNWRWQGVPFYLLSGKRLAAKRTGIEVQFKEVPCSMLRSVLGEHITANRLILGIQPDEAVKLTFQAKIPGTKMCLRSVTMRFDYGESEENGDERERRRAVASMDAYVKVLLDVMLGDHTLFWRQDAVELCWGFLTPILMECDCPEKGERLALYKAGSDGPPQARRILPEDAGGLGRTDSAKKER